MRRRPQPGPGAAPWDTLATIRQQCAALRDQFIELQSLALWLDNRPPDQIPAQDLVSALIWTALATANVSRVASNWGTGLIAHAESSLLAAGITPPDEPAEPTASTAPTKPAPRRRWQP